MVDNLTTQQRSALMKRVRREGTVPETVVRRIVRKLGYRIQSNDSRLPGSPDIVIPAHAIAIFVHGCYWHRHPGCKLASTPKSQRAFWAAKFDANVKRDRRKTAALRKMGFRIATIWACKTRDLTTLEVSVARRLQALVNKRTLAPADS